MSNIKFDWSTASKNPAQFGLITDTHRHSAFVGGLGSGKSWTGATKGILYALSNPGSLGIVAAPTYRQLRDSTMREFFKLLPNKLIKKWNKSEYELMLVNGSEILFRSLENYDTIRGVEIAWLWIDEANLVSYKAWRVAIGRLRQPGYPHRSWITTTPRGKTLNWVHREYVELPHKDAKLGTQRCVYHARTRDNIDNIGEEYVEDLEASYTGAFREQELEGQFVDIIEGRVYPSFDRSDHVIDLEFDPDLPLYGFWDYGFSDEGALWVAQTDTFPEHMSLPLPTADDPEILEERMVAKQKGLILLDVIIEDGQNADFWVDTVRLIEEQWKPFDKHYGDPAGEQREISTGKSMAGHLRKEGIYVRSKKRPVDQGRLGITRLLNNVLLEVSDECEMGIAAFTNYHWPLDPDGNRKPEARTPVHDWSSHPMDALRYGVPPLFPIFNPSPSASRSLNRRKRSSKVSQAPRGQTGSFVGVRKREF